MAKRKWKKKVVKVEIPEKEFQRWKFVDEDKRILLIDFRCIRTELFKKINYGARRKIKWQTPKQLESLIEEYFASCYDYLYDFKTQQPLLDAEGRPRKGQVEPFTVSGLALHIHISTQQLKSLSNKDIDALGMPTDEDYEGPTYSDLITAARQKIETYAEKRLFDKDGFNGGKFVLDCAFKWGYRKELAEIEKMKKEIELKERELQLKIEQAAAAEDTEDNTINVTIHRAGEE